MFFQHAQRAWKEFRIHNLEDYHDLYLRTNVVLLAKVNEVFREMPRALQTQSSTFLYISRIGLESMPKEHRNYIGAPN